MGRLTGLTARLQAEIVRFCAPRRPPLSCRTSPPQGGRLDGRFGFANRQRWRLAKSLVTANLPPRGGDVRPIRQAQDRGGRDRAPAAIAMTAILALLASAARAEGVAG